MFNNINTPNGIRLDKLTVNYKNLLNKIQVGEKKLKKYRKKLEEKKLIVKMLENKLEELKREKNNLGKVLKNNANAYSEMKKRKKYNNNNNNNNKMIMPKKLRYENNIPKSSNKK
jgi:hypothetical protein